MKKPKFLVKLFKEGKLELVKPSEEIKKSYMEKSESNLISAKILLKSNRLEEAIALAYYSMYNLLISLLFKTGIKCENHSGAIILLKDIFNIDNSSIFLAKKERVDKQYYTDFHVTKEETVNAIRETEAFNKKLLDFIHKISNREINDYREKFKDLIGL